MAFTVKDITTLREQTGAGMLDCKNALTECDGDMNKAADWLREKGIAKAIECLSNPDICRQYMRKVVSEWTIATTEVLTNPESNGRAWLGQCACFMYGGSHDEETRKAWCLLSPQVQLAANKVAEQVIYEWLSEYAKSCPNYQLTIFDIEV